MKKWLSFYLWASYRRKLIDTCLHNHRALFRGVVLDIGGRDRGQFVKPKSEVRQWIFADINPQHRPDLVLDVAHMTHIQTESMDVVCACELFEHVKEIDQGIRECYRVLKPGGIIMISVPFLYAVHADPDDYQRWTDTKWHAVLSEIGFTIETCTIMGRFFTVMGDHLKLFIRSLPSPLRWIMVVCAPLLDLMVQLDQWSHVAHHERLGKFHGGYFIVAQK